MLKSNLTDSIFNTTSVGFYTRTLLLIILFFCGESNYAQQSKLYYLPEYKFYFSLKNSDNQSFIKSIWGNQYLVIEVQDSCTSFNVSCFRSNDSTLKETGKYKNFNRVEEKKTIITHAGSDKSRIENISRLNLERIGIWKLYNRKGRITNKKYYKL